VTKPSAETTRTEPKKETQAVSAEEKAFRQIETSTDSSELRAFITNWSAKNPESPFVKQAKTLLSKLYPIQYDEKVLTDGRRVYRLLNVEQPRIKNMSLQSGLKINTANLLTSNSFEVELERSGEFAVLVKDASGKQATIKITDYFDASLTAIPGNNSWLLRIGGGRRPFRVYLKNVANPKDIKIWEGKLDSDTLTITQDALKARRYNQVYQVVVKSSDIPSKEAEAGTIEHAYEEGGTGLLDTIMFLLLLFVGLSAVYGLYLVLSYQKEKRRKATIYDRIQ
jgi:hypothetical protein